MTTNFRRGGIPVPLKSGGLCAGLPWCVWKKCALDPWSISLHSRNLSQDALIAEEVPPNTRVTLFVGASPTLHSAHGQQLYTASLASPMDPRAQEGRPWGYLTRIASTFQSMLQDSPFEGGYDLCIGTSERGEQTPSHDLAFRPYRHALVVIGGPQGLEACLQQDPWSAKFKDVAQMFDRYLNTCFHQGSRTIRTEEALFITLTFLGDSLQRCCLE